MYEAELIKNIDFCREIATRYEEPWCEIIFEKLLDKLISPEVIKKIHTNENDKTRFRIPGIIYDNVIKLSNILQITVDELLEIYNFDEDTLQIKQYDVDVDRSQAQAARELSALYLLACEIVHNRTNVTIDEITTVAKEWGAYDPSNFAYNHIQKAKWFKKNNDVVKLLYTCRKEVIPIVKRILNSDS